MAQGSKRSKKGLLNNPIVLVLILLLFAVVAGMQLGLLDTLFGAPAAPPASSTPTNGPKPVASAPATPTQTAPGASGTPAGTPGNPNPGKGNAAGTGGPASAGAKPGPAVAAAQGGQAKPASENASGTGQPGTQPAKAVAPKPKVPEFSFAVGRANPFASLSGASAKQPSGTARPAGQVSGPTGTGTAPISSGAQGETAPVKNPKAPWESWQFTGLSTHGQLRIAIIETPTTSYFVKVGDRIEGVWLVEEITSNRITLKSPERTLVLVLGGDKK